MQDKRYVRTDKEFAFATPLPPHRILIVNQYQLGAEELANDLRKAGHVVEIAHDEQSALATERAFTPQMVIIDFEGSPSIDANNLARSLRAQANRYVILVSTWIVPNDDDYNCQKECFDDHMNWVKATKPFLMRRRKWLTDYDSAEGIVRRVLFNCKDQFVVVMLAAAVCPSSPAELAPLIPDEFLQVMRALSESPTELSNYLIDHKHKVFAEAEYWEDVLKGASLWSRFFNP